MALAPGVGTAAAGAPWRVVNRAPTPTVLPTAPACVAVVLLTLTAGCVEAQGSQAPPLAFTGTYHEAGSPVYPFKMLACGNLTFRGDCTCGMDAHGAFVRVTTGFEAEDRLWCDGCVDLAISESYDAVRGILSLRGERSLAEWVEILRTVQFNTATTTRVEKHVQYNFGRAIYSAETEHYYRLTGDANMECSNVGNNYCRWDFAQLECATPSHDHFGLVGYVFTPDAPDELALDVIHYDGAANPLAWVGCHDGGVEGSFTWMVGPGACENYFTGTNGTSEQLMGRSGCYVGDGGYMFENMTPDPLDCTRPGVQCVGKVPVPPSLFRPGQPDDNFSGPGGAFIQGEDFCRHDPTTDTLADFALHPGDSVLVWYCEYGGVGDMCVDGTVGTSVLQFEAGVDECSQTAPPAYNHEYAGPGDTPFAVSCVDIAKSLGRGCDCQTATVSGARVVLYIIDVDDRMTAPPRAGVAVDDGLASPADPPLRLDANVAKSPLRYLTFTPAAGAMTIAEALEVINSVRIELSAAPLRRRIVWNLGDGVHVASTGSYYKTFTPAQAGSAATGLSWDEAAAFCADPTNDHLGMAGYLATFTTPSEYYLATATLRARGQDFWIGASDAGKEGEWRWVAGPEGCRVYNLSRAGAARTHCDIFPVSRDPAAACGGPQCGEGAPLDWDAWLFGQPDDGTTTAPAGEDFAVVRQWDASGIANWEDHVLKSTQTSPVGLICEWSPYVGDLCVAVTHGAKWVVPSAYMQTNSPHAEYVCGELGLQGCIDPDHTTLNDFTCSCLLPSHLDMFGTVTPGKPLPCTLDECWQPAAATVPCNTCPPAWFDCGRNAECHDPDIGAGALGDWYCRCRSPFQGPQARADLTGQCILDECIGQLCESFLQLCVEPDVNVLDDWYCDCPPPAYMVELRPMFLAGCEIDECSAGQCATCIPAAGCRAGQTCSDPNRRWNTGFPDNDWECRCDAPTQGVAVRGYPTCVLDECVPPQCAIPSGSRVECAGSFLFITEQECLALSPLCCFDSVTDECFNDTNRAQGADGVCGPGQTCTDPDTSTGSVGDYECACISPEAGTAIGQRVPACALDECTIHTCAAGQQCVDDAPLPTSRDDWSCVCDVPSVDVARGANATCTVDECATTAGCGPERVCVEGSIAATALGDYRCECRAPAVPKLLSLGNEVCVLDECTATCGTCANGICAAAGQTCRDSRQTLGAVADWQCLCTAGDVGDPATAGVAACRPETIDECVDDCDTCAPGPCGEGQACVDFSTDGASLGDWVCRCVWPWAGVAVKMGNATCEPDVPDLDAVETDVPAGATLGGANTSVPLTATLGGKHPLPGIEVLTQTGTAAAGLSVLRGGGNIANWLAVVTGDCTERQRPEDYTRSLNPLQLTIRGSVALGVVVGNAVVCVGVWLVVFLAVKVLNATGLRPDAFEDSDIRAVVRFPAIPITIFILTYQGTSLSAVELAMRPRDGIDAAVGYAAIALCVAVPIYAFRVVYVDVPRKGYYMRDPETRHWLMVLFIGPGEWVSRRRESNWVLRWGVIVQPFREPTSWYLIYEMMASMALSGSNAVVVEDSTACGHVKIACGIVMTVMAACEAALCPRCWHRNNVLTTAFLGLQAGGMLCMAFGFYSDDPESRFFEYTSDFLFAAIVVMGITLVLDAAAIVYALLSGRVKRCQERAYELEEQKTAREEEEEEELLHVIDEDVDGRGGAGGRKFATINFGSEEPPTMKLLVDDNQTQSTGDLVSKRTLGYSCSSRDAGTDGLLGAALTRGNSAFRPLASDSVLPNFASISDPARSFADDTDHDPAGATFRALCMSSSHVQVGVDASPCEGRRGSRDPLQPQPVATTPMMSSPRSFKSLRSRRFADGPSNSEGIATPLLRARQAATTPLATSPSIAAAGRLKTTSSPPRQGAPAADPLDDRAGSSAESATDGAPCPFATAGSWVPITVESQYEELAEEAVNLLPGAAQATTPKRGTPGQTSMKHPKNPAGGSGTSHFKAPRPSLVAESATSRQDDSFWYGAGIGSMMIPTRTMVDDEPLPMDADNGRSPMAGVAPTSSGARFMVNSQQSVGTTHASSPLLSAKGSIIAARGGDDGGDMLSAHSASTEVDVATPKRRLQTVRRPMVAAGGMASAPAPALAATSASAKLLNLSMSNTLVASVRSPPLLTSQTPLGTSHRSAIFPAPSNPTAGGAVERMGRSPSARSANLVALLNVKAARSAGPPNGWDARVEL